MSDTETPTSASSAESDTGSILDAVRVVLYEPQDPINIAAIVRAMKNMGFAELRLVRPCEYEPNRIEQVAHNTRDIVARIRHFDTLEAALADCVRVAAFTARRRSARWEVTRPREMAAEMLEWVEQGPVAVLFGREDHGLPNDALDLAHVHVNIPTTNHASINVAQAVLIALYERHVAAGDATRRLRGPRRKAPMPTGKDFALTFADVARTLNSVRFFRTRNAAHVMRAVRTIAFRARPDYRELYLVRAMAIEVLRTLDRVRRGIEPAPDPNEPAPPESLEELPENGGSWQAEE